MNGKIVDQFWLGLKHSAILEARPRDGGGSRYRCTPPQVLGGAWLRGERGCGRRSMLVTHSHGGNTTFN